MQAVATNKNSKEWLGVWGRVPNALVLSLPSWISHLSSSSLAFRVQWYPAKSIWEAYTQGMILTVVSSAPPFFLERNSASEHLAIIIRGIFIGETKHIKMRQKRV